MKRRLTILALTALTVVALNSVALAVPAPALAGGPPPHARGATQFSGTGYFPGDPNGSGRLCDEPPAFPGTDPVLGILALDFTGGLEGCFYSYVLSYESSPSGTYRERGIDIFVGKYKGEDGTFETTYLFTAKFEDLADPATELFGRCQHPIVAGSGTGVFEGVTGRVDIKDVIGGDTTTFDYRGHLRY